MFAPIRRSGRAQLAKLLCATILPQQRQLFVTPVVLAYLPISVPAILSTRVMIANFPFAIALYVGGDRVVTMFRLLICPRYVTAEAFVLHQKLVFATIAALARIVKMNFVCKKLPFSCKTR